MDEVAVYNLNCMKALSMWTNGVKSFHTLLLFIYHYVFIGCLHAQIILKKWQDEVFIWQKHLQ